MGKQHEEITPELVEWIGRQRVFFVASAPLATDGIINCSPKGLDTFRVLGPRSAAYLDLTGSGIETVAHLRENGRIVLMFCAFDGPPRICRLHGRGRVLTPEGPAFADLRSRFPADLPGVRSIVHVEVTRVSTSCGFGVPRYNHAGDRDQLTKWATTKGAAGLAEYRAAKNARSLDGLPGL
jgi:hypothetical protein